nr:MFS transporter [Rhizobium sp. FKY42]
MFHGPIIDVFYLSHGLTFKQIFLIQGLHYVGKLLASIPAGMFADRYRRKSALAIGAFLVAISYFGIGIGSGFAFFAAMEILAGIGRAFLAGPESAYLFDELERAGRRAEYEWLESLNYSVVNGTLIVVFLLSGPFASIALNLPYILSAITLFVATAVALTLPEGRECSTAGEVRQPVPVHLAQMLGSFRTVTGIILRSDTLLFATILSCAFVLIRELNYLTEQPLLIALSFPFHLYGVLPAVGSALWAGSSCLAPFVMRRFGQIGSNLLLASSAFGLAFALTIVPVSYASISIYGAFYIFYGLAEPIIRIVSNSSVPDARMRSTVLAFQASISLMPFCLGASAYGHLLDQKPLTSGFASLTVIAWLALLTVCLWFLRLRLRSARFTQRVWNFRRIFLAGAR